VESGKLLEHKQLRRHPRLKKTWDTSYANELGRLCQGVGEGTAGPKKQRVAGTGTFRVINYDDIPQAKRSDICHTRVVCEYRADKDDPNRTRITLAGGHICVPYDVSTPTGSLELVKLMINSVLSRENARFAAFDVKNFYLDTPMKEPEYVRVLLKDIPQEFIDEYNLEDHVRFGWVYFAVVRGCYGLPQSGRLAHDLLSERLDDAGYYETATTPGLWRHRWRPIQFVLIVDDFGVEYVRKKDADHLAKILKAHHKISQDWEGKKFSGINLDWNYAPKHEDRTCRLTMKNYISDLLVALDHPRPKRRQLSPHKCKEIQYGSKVQQAHGEDTSPPLTPKASSASRRLLGRCCGLAARSTTSSWLPSAR